MPRTCSSTKSARQMAEPDPTDRLRKGLAHGRLPRGMGGLGAPAESVRNKLLDDGRSREDSEILVQSCTTRGGEMAMVTSAHRATRVRGHDPDDSTAAALPRAAVHRARHEWTNRP